MEGLVGGRWVLNLKGCHGGYEREGVELLTVLLLSLEVLMTSTESQVRELERNNVSVEHIRK